MTKKILFAICFALILSIHLPAQAKLVRQMEKLSRGLVAINKGDGKVFVSWRMFGTDADNIAFNLYRETDGKAVKLNDKPIADVTFFIDEKADLKKANS